MNGSHHTVRNIQRDLESLLETLMGDAQPAAVNSALDRLEADLDSCPDTDMTPGVLPELRSAVELLRDGSRCAAVSALLSARSSLLS